MAMNAAQMGTWEWNITDNTAKWSDATKRMFGLLRRVIRKNFPKIFLHSCIPEDRLFVEQAINRAITEGAPYEAEFRVLQPDGSVRWVRGKGKVVKDEAGKLLRMIGLNADITEHKQAEQALRRERSQVGTN